MRRNLLLLLALGLIALGLGCVPLVTGVSAYAPADPVPFTRYALEGPDPRRPGGDPRWPVRAAMVVKSLAVRGYTRDEASPEFVLRVSYGSGETRTYEHVSRPTHRAGAPTTTRYDVATHLLRVEALDPASLASGNPEVLWSTLGEVRESTFDLDRMFPFMLASMEPHFGRSASARVVVTKRLWDEEAKRLSRP